MTRRRGSVLLVDDEEKLRKTLGRALRAEGHEVIDAVNGRDALKLLATRPVDVLVTDNMMPGMTGIELAREYIDARLRDAGAAGAPGANDEPAHVILMTAHATVDSAIDAMKLGAIDYLRKPFEIEELLATVARALERPRLRSEGRIVRGERVRGEGPIVGCSSTIRAVIDRIDRVAETKSTVLVTGETGTGKELVARAIHDRSAQRDMPLVKVNCAAIPETVLESELFGHVRGAFTDAIATRRGKFALADGGTILLDEIAGMTPALQAKVLRVLQERELEPLGAERSEHVDVRVIAATNRDLRQMVADGRFLSDLFYRLNVIPIEIPPLRDRRDDIAALATHFVRKHAQRTGRPVTGIDASALGLLRQYDWPGNVRELENTVERSVVLSHGPIITAADLSIAGGPARASGLPSLELRRNLEWVERDTIRLALDRAGGVRKDAAALMGISQRALSHYLRKLAID